MVWYHLSSLWSISFSISWSTDLLITNASSFYLDTLLFYLHFWRTILLNVELLVNIFVFVFQPTYPSSVFCTSLFLLKDYPFSSSAFLLLPSRLCLLFCLSAAGLWRSFVWFPLRFPDWICQASWIWRIMILTNLGQFLRHYFLKYLSITLFPLLLMPPQLHTCLDSVSQTSKICTVFLKFLSLFFRLENPHWSSFQVQGFFFMPSQICWLDSLVNILNFSYCIFKP